MSTDSSLPSFMERFDVQIPKYASGCYGEISLAVDRSTSKRVILKRLPKTNPSHMIQNEVKAGMLIEPHPNIAGFVSYTEFKDFHLMIFEFVDGVELFAFMEQREFNPLPESAARTILTSIASALVYSHSKGIAHRDVKLENVLINRDAKATLIDYGLCAVVPVPFKSSRECCGSDNYIAPEIVRRRPYDPFKADVFSLGVVAFALLYGVFPFENLAVEGKFRMNLPTLQVRFPSSTRVTEGAKSLLYSMLQDDPERRISMEEVLQHSWMAAQNE